MTSRRRTSPLDAAVWAMMLLAIVAYLTLVWVLVQVIVG
jgi:hypothetical protein